MQEVPGSNPGGPTSLRPLRGLRLASQRFWGEMVESHLSDSHLERYVTGMIHDKGEIRWVEEHLFHCEACTERMWVFQESMDAQGSSAVETETPELYRKGRPLQ